MKKKYEKKEALILLIIVFIILEVYVICIYLKKNYRTYSSINSIVVTDNYIKMYIDNSTLKKIQSRKNFYVDDKKYNYKIINIDKNIMKKDNKSINEIMINFKIPKKYKDNDTIVISIFDRKEKIYKIFKKIWESDL